MPTKALSKRKSPKKPAPPKAAHKKPKVKVKAVAPSEHLPSSTNNVIWKLWQEKKQQHDKPASHPEPDHHKPHHGAHPPKDHPASRFNGHRRKAS